MGIGVRRGGYDNDIDRLKSSIDLRDALCPGMAGRRKYVLRHCPIEIHGKSDSNPSLAVNADYWYCFGCGHSGSVFDWVMRVAGATFPVAVDMVRRGDIPKGRVEINGHGGNTKPKPQTWAREFKQEWYSLDVQNRTGFILSLAGKGKSKGYFTDERKIAAKVADSARLGYHLSGVYVIPVWDSRGVLVGAKLRRDDDVTKDAPKYDSVDLPLIYNERGIQLSARNKRPLVITEGELDSLVVLGVSGYEAVSFTYGTESVSRWWKVLQERAEKPVDFYGVGKLLVSFDGDEAGQRAENVALGIFSGFVPVVRAVHLPDGSKDVTEFVVKHGYDPLRNLLNGIAGIGQFRRVWTVR